VSLTVDNVVQENSGTVTTTTASLVATLPSGTTDGNTVVVILTHASSSGATTMPAGFVLSKGTGGVGGVFVYHKPEVGGGETSWTFTIGAGVASHTWYAAEVSNVDPVDPVDVSASSSSVGTSVATGGTLSTGTTPLNAGLSTLVLSAFGVNKTSGAATLSWAGYTNGSDEALDIEPAGEVGFGLAVGRKFTDGSTSTFETTATLTHTAGGTLTAWALIVAFRAADSPIVAPLAHFMGFEQGTSGGLNASGAVSPFAGPLTPVGTWGTSYLIQAGSARNGGYGLRIVQSAGAVYVRAGNVVNKSAAVGMNVRVVSATGTVVVAELADTPATPIYSQLLYDSSATKFGIRCGTTGTVSWESGTTALNTWRWVDWRFKCSTSTWAADWRIETAADTYTDQAATSLAGQATTSFDTLHLGANVSQTMTADFDDVIISRHYVAYPLGPHQVRLLTVDPAGTPSLSGTSTNFSVFTANGTLAAWNAVNARNAVDEVPPTVSASADGICQTAVAASDYIEFPMATYTLGADEFVSAVRMLAAAWGGTGTGTGTLGLRGWDGTTETTLVAASTSYDAGSPTAVSATEPLWQCAMWQSTNGWTQAELDAAAVRVGFSTDATPDMGVHVVYLETAVGKTKTQQLFGDLASAEVDPTRLGVVSVTVDAPTMGTGDTTLEYEESGSPTSIVVPEGTTTIEQINAPDQPTVNRITMYWPPEPEPSA
jgi:hypothetical protein